jgi:hypothetical protein
MWQHGWSAPQSWDGGTHRGTWRDLGVRYRARTLGLVEMKGKGPVEVVECAPEVTAS